MVVRGHESTTRKRVPGAGWATWLQGVLVLTRGKDGFFAGAQNDTYEATAQVSF